MSVWTVEGHCQSLADSTAVGEARRSMGALARAALFSEELAGAVAIVVTELGNNLVRHAGGGELILNSYSAEGRVRLLELLAVDKGPGMADMQKCMRDGYSTGGTPGTGLGAARRMADFFDIHSAPGRGTVVVARFSPNHDKTTACIRVGGISLPVRGEHACGDAWAVVHKPGGTVLLAVDGLGHGHGAAEAAHEAIRIFRERVGESPVRILNHMHAAMRSTRGAAVALAEICVNPPSLHYAGIGNISGVLVREGVPRSLISHNGTVGHETRRVQGFTYPWGDDAILLMHSDGLNSRWKIDSYPGLIVRHPSLVAATLYRDFRRERDDITVLGVRA